MGICCSEQALRILLPFLHCFALFSCTLTVAENIMKKSSHILQGYVLEVKLYTPSMETELEELPLDTVEVSNVPKTVTKETLELYFESPKAGGHEEGVKDIRFISPGVAHIKFSDPKSEL